MRHYGPRSLKVRGELDLRLVAVFDEILWNVTDHSLVSGHRGETKQNALFHDGLSKLEFPQSKHNKYPSLAVDFQPYPYPSTEPKLWAGLAYIAAHAILIGKEQGVTLRWGGDWDRDGDLSDQNFNDLFHMEIVECDTDYPR